MYGALEVKVVSDVIETYTLMRYDDDALYMSLYYKVKWNLSRGRAMLSAAFGGLVSCLSAVSSTMNDGAYGYIEGASQ